MVRVEQKTLFIPRVLLTKLWKMALEAWPEPLMGKVVYHKDSHAVEVECFQCPDDFPLQEIFASQLSVFYFMSEHHPQHLPNHPNVISLILNLNEKGVLQMKAPGLDEVVIED